MDLSIVIASYNTHDVTQQCLESIHREIKELVYEVIVIDNASGDGSVEMIRREFPEVKLICNKRNVGFAAAQNMGLSRAKGRYLLVLNSDVLFIGNAAKTLIERLEEGPENLGVVGPQVRNPDGTIAASGRRALASRPMLAVSIFNRHFNIKRFFPADEMVSKYLGFLLARWHDNYARHTISREVDFVDGMCVLIKREVLKEVGLFDEQFFFDAEIIDLSNRIRQQGWRIEFYPEAQVVHLGHASRKKVPRILVETHRSELIYYAKYAPEIVPFIQKVDMVVMALRLLRLWGKGLLFGSDDAWHEEWRVCQEGMRVCREFEIALVAANEKIPALSMNAGAHQL